MAGDGHHQRPPSAALRTSWASRRTAPRRRASGGARLGERPRGAGAARRAHDARSGRHQAGRPGAPGDQPQGLGLAREGVGRPALLDLGLGAREVAEGEAGVHARSLRRPWRAAGRMCNRSPSVVRRTKILATLGPSTDAPGRLDALVAAGMDGGRINCAHDGPGQWALRAAGLRAAAQRAGRPLALMMDLAGPKMRLGAAAEREVARGERIVFAAGEDRADGAVPTAWPGLADAVTIGRSEIVIGDGTPRLRVVDARPAEGTVTATVERPGRIGPRKGIYVTYVQSPASTLGDRDLADLEVACELDADVVALSFVRSGVDVRRLRGALGALGSEARRDRQDREGGGLRGPRGDRRRLRRRHGRARRPGRGGRRREGAADAEGGHPAGRRPGQAHDHGHPDAGVDDRPAGADARRGDRRRQRDPRRHVGGDALGRDERRPLPGRGRGGDGRDRRRGRARRAPVAGAADAGAAPRRGRHAVGGPPGPAGGRRGPRR